MKKARYNVAVVGATGVVGKEMLAILEERSFPVDQLKPLASERSLGKEVTFRGKDYGVELLGEKSFTGVDVALFSAGGTVSERFAPLAAESGAVVIDNTSAFRMNPEIPLVVPEVNGEAIAGFERKRIIANPNCSTIQLVMVLKPLHDAATLKRVVVATYQSTSGAGQRAIQELEGQIRALFGQQELVKEKFPHQIAFNCLPHIDVFLDNGYTKEEMKMILESRKILGLQGLPMTATCVRVPVFYSHSEAVNIETEKALSAGEARERLAAMPGVQVIDNVEKNEYPLAVTAAGKDPVFVGRIRADESVAHGLNLWIVADNLRKGAALNAVQIAEILIEKYI